MSLPDQTPKLPKLPFLLGDAALLGAAWYIATRDPGPLSLHAVAAVTACVVLAAILGAVPFLTDYARKQDEALDERQRGLEALSRTINTAAEQISIAANGINELTDLTHKNLKQAEQLPHKLQDKIAEFNAQLNNASQDDREELEKELGELRISETERLQAIADKVHMAITDLTRLDSSLQQHANSRVDSIERAHATFVKTNTEATAALSQTNSALNRDFADRQTAALTDIDRKLAERAALIVSAIDAATRQAVETLNATRGTVTTGGSPADPASGPAGAETSEKPDNVTGVVPLVASPPKRPRKARRDDAAPADVDLTVPAAVKPASAATADESGAIPPEPAPIPLGSIAHVAPVAPYSADPFSSPLLLPSADSPAGASTGLGSESTPVPESWAKDETAATAQTEQPSRKRATRSSGDDATPDLFGHSHADESADSDDAPVTSAEMMERVISSDCATRLIAIAYIGIGNRLFIRGDGPGLSWERGVPLQFVSIGKWRWETAEASAPIAFKLYKNDEIECPGLGQLSLEPGHQQEVAAKF